MKCRVSILVVIIICFSMINDQIYNYELTVVDTNPLEEKGFNSTAIYVVSELIEINSNSDFINQGWPGNGSADNPFLIEDLLLSSDTDCIRISNTNMFFEIRNCSLTSLAETYQRGIGLRLTNVTNGLMESCLLDGLGVGVYDRNGRGNRILRNTITQNYDGVIVDSSTQEFIANNTITDGMSGIQIHSSFDCRVVSNNVSQISLLKSSNCILSHNNVGHEGFHFISNNLTHWMNQLTMNYIDGKKVGFFRDASQLDIDGNLYSQLIIVNCTQIAVRNGLFRNLHTGIYLAYSTSSIIANVNASENHNYGIIIENTSNCSLSDSVFLSNLRRGVFVISSSNISLSNIVASNSSESGIHLHSSDDCSTSGCIVAGNSVGISLELARDSILIDNDVFENGVGIILAASNNSQIVSNTIHENEYGLRISSSSHNNSIYWNSFTWNSVENAGDDGTHNSWDDAIARGNVWSDYNGIGPYTIPGLAESIDRFPQSLSFIIVIDCLLFSLIIMVSTVVIWWWRKGRLRRGI